MAVDFSRKLTSGITVGELMERAEAWWGEYRGMVPRELTRWKTERASVGHGGPLLKFLSLRVDRSVGNSLLGVSWAELAPQERATIAVIWHDYVMLEGRDDGRLMATDKVAPQAEIRH